MGQPVVHFEIGCKDIPRTQEFYAKLFDWNIQPAGPGGYDSDRRSRWNSGHLTALGHEPYNYVTVYIEVDDIPAYLAKAEQLGGKKLVGPIEIPTGSFAWMADPEGTTIGLFKPK